MLKELISLAWFEGGAIGDLLSAWEQAGFFTYLLPFLLIFALVFGILNQIQLFKEKKAINAIIALVVGLMSLQFPMVPLFFSEIFPRLGVGLAIILVILIFVGMFIDPGKAGIFYILMGIGAVIVVVVLVQSAGALGWSSGQWWVDNWSMIAGAVFILVIIAIIVGTTSRGDGTKGKGYQAFWPWGFPGSPPK